MIPHPTLKTTGVIHRFTKKLVYEIRLNNQDLSDFLSEWKLTPEKEAEHLYYGKIYRVKDISPNHLVLKARKRGGTAYHFIDCTLNNDSSKMVMKIQTPNSAAYVYICLAMVVGVALFFLKDPSNLNLSMNTIVTLLFYASFGILVGIFFLNASLLSAKRDMKREMYKLKGLKPIN